MIDCKRTSELLPDFLAEQLNESDRTAVLDHINACSTCSELAAVWGELGDLPDEVPSPRLRQRFDAVLDAYRLGSGASGHRVTRPWLWKWNWTQWAWPVLAAAALVIGLAIGRFTVPSTSDQQEQIAALQAEVHTTRQLVALSLLEQRSASERLRGVNWSQRLEEPDPQVISALVHALRYDSSVDVRLAALDALRRYRSNPEVREALLQSLNSAQSPLVQISVIDLLVDARDPAAPGALRQLRSSPSVNTAVRKHAEWALQQF